MRHPAFKTHDIQGRLGTEPDGELAWRIGRDGRESGPRLAAALAQGLPEGGMAVRDLGLCGAEEV